MAFTPPVIRDKFLYNGELYVFGKFNRHKRATVGEISALLRPDVKKSTKASSNPPSKDQVGHWYEAQLIHYGLPPSKDKARAKMRLLEALNNSSLAVPTHVAQMETEMKEEFDAAERKARADLKAVQTSVQEDESQITGKKRRRSDSSGNVDNININITMGNNTPQVVSGEAPMNDLSPTKKAKTGSSTSSRKKTEKPGAAGSSKSPQSFQNGDQSIDHPT